MRGPWRRRTLQDFINEASDKHQGKYDYSRIDLGLDDLIYFQFKVLIVCPKHGEFHQSVHSHMRGHGCRDCGQDRRRSQSYSDQDDFLKKSFDVHGDKYDYSLSEYDDCRTPVSIICPLHGEFLQAPRSHIRGHGCPSCGISTSISKNSGNLDDFILRSQLVHDNFYSYEDSVYINCFTKLIINCPVHGKFEQKPNSHLFGCGCPTCGFQRASSLRFWTQEQFVAAANFIHHFTYDYSSANYQGSQTPVEITCADHGIFLKTPNSHIHGATGCPECYGHKSKGEFEISTLLDLNGINFIPQKTFEDCINPRTNWNLFFDFYLPDLNTLIEYDGAQHFKPVAHWGGEKTLKVTQERDKIKNDYCLSSGIELIRITYKDNILESLRKFRIIPL